MTTNLTTFGNFAKAGILCALIGGCIGACVGALVGGISVFILLPYPIAFFVASIVGCLVGTASGGIAGFIGGCFGGSPGFRVGGVVAGIVSVVPFFNSPYAILILVSGFIVGSILDWLVKKESPSHPLIEYLKTVLGLISAYSSRTKNFSGDRKSVV